MRETLGEGMYPEDCGVATRLFGANRATRIQIRMVTGMPRKRSPEAEARAVMKTLGIYRQEFEPMIRAYGELREQYNTLTPAV